ncbi:MAG TPA: histidine kinase [Propionibacteriaceae bacterium]
MPTPSTATSLTRWGAVWRLLVASLGGLLLWLATFEVEPEPGSLLPLWDLLLGIGAIVLLAQRRRWPFVVALLTTASTVISATAFAAALIAVISLATTRRWRAIGVVVAVGIVTGPVAERLAPASGDPLAWWVVVLFCVGVYGLAVVLGLYIGARRDLARAQDERRANAEREQAARVEQARAYERAEIAREMHDVLAHRISLVAMHAGAMTYRTDLGADELRGSAQVIQDNAHQALTDLREVLGVLRTGPGGDPTEPPQPTLVDLPALVEEARSAGNPVQLDVRIAGERVPDRIGRTAYRVVQEALTNVRKHAPGQIATVTVSGAPDSGLEVAVSNVAGAAPSAVPGAGLGLVGLAERTTLAGGELWHGPTAAGTFVVRARLPWAP